MKNKSILYIIIRPIVALFIKCFFTPKIKGVENIPKKGSVVLAGNHTSKRDCFMLISATNREVHFLVKRELFDGPFGWFFKSLGLVAVDRKAHALDAFGKAKEYLDAGEVIGIPFFILHS